MRFSKEHQSFHTGAPGASFTYSYTCCGPANTKIELPDKFRQRQLPLLLVMVVQLSELLWVHPQLTCHLHVLMRKAELASCIDPRLQVCRYLGLPQTSKRTMTSIVSPQQSSRLSSQCAPLMPRPLCACRSPAFALSSWTLQNPPRITPLHRPMATIYPIMMLVRATSPSAHSPALN
jgi:hypothetical protein